MASLGLWYVRERWLQSSGRWHSVDPVPTEPAYQYVRNMPTMAVDPSGRGAIADLGQCLAGARRALVPSTLYSLAESWMCRRRWCEATCDVLASTVTAAIAGCLGGIFGGVAMDCAAGAVLGWAKGVLSNWCANSLCHANQPLPGDWRTDVCSILAGLAWCVVLAIAGHFIGDAIGESGGYEAYMAFRYLWGQVAALLGWFGGVIGSEICQFYFP